MLIVSFSKVCYVESSDIYQSMVRPGKFANPARGQLQRKMIFSLSPFALENSVSRDRFGRPVAHQPAHSPHSG